MSKPVKNRVDHLRHEAESVFKKMKEIKAAVASANEAIQKDETLMADSDLIQQMIGICDELGLETAFDKTRRSISSQPDPCWWCAGGGGK